MKPKKVCIAIDDWKLPIFERHLSQAGYAYEHSAGLTRDTFLISISTKNVHALGAVVLAANTEAVLTKQVRQ